MIELLVFDTAGTTVADGGQVFNAFRDALGQQQIVVTEADLQPWRGASKRSVLRAFVEQRWGSHSSGNDQRVEDAYAAFQSSLEEGFGRAGSAAHPWHGGDFCLAAGARDQDCPDDRFLPAGDGPHPGSDWAGPGVPLMPAFAAMTWPRAGPRPI